MNYLFCITDFCCGGGAQKQLYWLARELAKSDSVRIMVLTSKAYRQDDWSYIESCRDRNIPVDILNNPGQFKSVRTLIAASEICRQYKPDIVVAFMFHSIIYMRLLRLLRRYPVLIDSYRNAKEPRCIRKKMVQGTAWLSDAMVYNSSDHSLRLAPDKRSHTIYNIVEPFTVPQKHEQRGTFQWISVCRLIKHKNIDIVIKGLQMLVNRGYDMSLCICGDGPEREALERLSSNLGVEKRVVFIGVVSNIPELLAESDGFIQVSSWEGLSNSMLEAGLAGLPMVLTQVSGVEDIFGDKARDSIVPFRDEQATANAMEKVMALCEESRQRVGQAMRGCVLDHCELHSCVDQWKKLASDVYRAKKGGLT